VDLRKLRYFVGVAEAGGFRRAAGILLVAQPSLNKHVRELKRKLEVKLFERGHLGVQLTPQGRCLLAESKAILERVDNLRASVVDQPCSIRGSFRIGAPASIAALLFGPLAERVHGAHPDLHVVCCGYGSRLLELLEDDAIDAAILTSVNAKEIGPAWRCDHLVREQGFLVGRDHEIFSHRPVKMEQVVGLPLVLTPLPNSRRQQLERLANAIGVRLNVVAEAEALGAHISFVRQGLGLAVRSYSAAMLMKASGGLEIAPIDDSWSWRLLVRRADRPLTTASMVISGMIAELFSEMAARGTFRGDELTEMQH
jgi:LysR family transcriptional regulator, nitrogen assimilation regulatory protein